MDLRDIVTKNPCTVRPPYTKHFLVGVRVNTVKTLTRERGRNGGEGVSITILVLENQNCQIGSVNNKSGERA